MYEVIAVSRSGKNITGYLVSGNGGVYYCARYDFISEVLKGNIAHVKAFKSGNSYMLSIDNVPGGFKSIREMTLDEKAVYIGNNKKSVNKSNKSKTSEKLNKDTDWKRLVESYDLEDEKLLHELKAYVILIKRLYSSILKDNNLVSKYTEISFFREDLDNGYGLRADFGSTKCDDYCGIITITNIFGEIEPNCYIYTCAFNYKESDDPDESSYVFNYNDSNNRLLAIHEALKSIIFKLEQYQS